MYTQKQENNVVGSAHHTNRHKTENLQPQHDDNVVSIKQDLGTTTTKTMGNKTDNVHPKT
jgi:hypothetical protein